jgi:hypothetical protein
MPCHRPGGGGPFNLITFKDVAKRSEMVELVTSTRYMPPWPADRSYSHFANERGLTDEQIALISKWHKQGAVKGNISMLPEVPSYDDRSHLGKPDAILSLVPVPIEGNNRDKFFILKIPFNLPKDTFVRTLEFISGRNQVVHHANGHLLNFDFDKKNDVYGGKYIMSTDLSEVDYVSQFDSLSLYHDDGTIPQRIHSAINYLPGMLFHHYPEGLGGFPISRKGAIVLNDLHYGPIPKDVIDSSFINIFYAKEPPKRPTTEVMMGTNGVSAIEPPLLVEPGKIQSFVTRWRTPKDVSLLSINPHMHLLGKSMTAFAVKPNGDTIPLIRIPEWDFRWQYIYTFEKMLRVPRGSVITVIAEYDNTSDNPNNPFDPPRPIGERLDKNGASMRTTDEMFQFIITLLPYQEGDENISLKSHRTNGSQE